MCVCVSVCICLCMNVYVCTYVIDLLAVLDLLFILNTFLNYFIIYFMNAHGLVVKVAGSQWLCSESNSRTGLYVVFSEQDTLFSVDPDALNCKNVLWSPWCEPVSVFVLFFDNTGGEIFVVHCWSPINDLACIYPGECKFHGAIL